VKGRLIRLLDEVKTEDAQQALQAIGEGASSDHLKQSARTVLDRNFPPPAAAKPVPAKGKQAR
jgi:hypothetical protein